MADTYKSWNHSSDASHENDDDPTATRRLIAIITASLLVFALIAGAVGFVAKRHFDEKQRERLAAARSESEDGGGDGTEIFTNVYENVEPSKGAEENKP